MPSPPMPSRESIIARTADSMYKPRILNNSHRGDVAEMIVLAALEPEWKFVGLGWHPWDLQLGSDLDRVRIQVKNTAALQLWGPTKTLKLSFPWKGRASAYFARDNPGEPIEDEGWFCDIFVFGVYQRTDEAADHADPAQWEFLVVPVSDLAPRTSSMVLTEAVERWRLLGWSELRLAVTEVATRSPGKTQLAL